MRLLLGADEGGLKGKDLYISYYTMASPTGRVAGFRICDPWCEHVPMGMALVVCQALKVRSLHVCAVEEAKLETDAPPPPADRCTLDREDLAPLVVQTGNAGALWVPRLTSPEPTLEERISADVAGVAVRRAEPTDQGSPILSSVCSYITDSVSEMLLDLKREDNPGRYLPYKNTGGAAFALTAGATRTFIYGAFADHPCFSVADFIGVVPVTLLRPSDHHLASVFTCFLNKRLAGADLRFLPVRVLPGCAPMNEPAGRVRDYCAAAGAGAARRLSPAAVKDNAVWMGATLRHFEQADTRGWVCGDRVTDRACGIISPLSMCARA